MANNKELDIRKTLLSKLADIDVDTIGQGAAERFRFEHSLLSVAGLSHESETARLKQAIGEQAPNKEAAAEERESDED